MLYSSNIWVAFVLVRTMCEHAMVFERSPKNNKYIVYGIVFFVSCGWRAAVQLSKVELLHVGNFVRNSEFGFSGRLMRSDAGGV